MVMVFSAVRMLPPRVRAVTLTSPAALALSRPSCVMRAISGLSTDHTSAESVGLDGLRYAIIWRFAPACTVSSPVRVVSASSVTGL